MAVECSGALAACQSSPGSRRIAQSRQLGLCSTVMNKQAFSELDKQMSFPPSRSPRAIPLLLRDM